MLIRMKQSVFVLVLWWTSLLFVSVTSSLSKDEDAIPQQLENTLLRGGNPVPAASNAANTSRTVKPVPEVKVIIHSSLFLHLSCTLV